MFQFLEHTADIRIKITAQSYEELFYDGMMGISKLISEPRLTSGQAVNQSTDKSAHSKQDETISTREISLEADNLTKLLIDFLNEVVTLSHVHKEVYTDVVFNRLSKFEVRAELSGQPVESFQKDIKAVTYHGAEVERNNDGKMEVVVVLDI